MKFKETWNAIAAIFRNKQIAPEELRALFKERIRNFRLLVKTNNRVLESMYKIEQALRGAHPFGYDFVQSSCTTVANKVYQVIEYLNALAQSNKYENLFQRFNSIQEQIQPYIDPQPPIWKGPLAVRIREINKDMVDQVGGKMANLGELRNKLLLRVPAGFVITTAAYQRFMETEELGNKIVDSLREISSKKPEELYNLSSKLQKMIIQTDLPLELEEEIIHHYSLLEKRKGQKVRVVMRSSAMEEDQAGRSFAGQYKSKLNVGRSNILEAYKEIVASKYSFPAMSYRFNFGIRDQDVAMSVGCMVMLYAICGGVLYSRDPLNFSSGNIVISSNWGLPKTVVDGSAPCDLFILERGNPIRFIRRQIPTKPTKYVCYEDEGVCKTETNQEKIHKPSLTDAQIIKLAHHAHWLELYYGKPVDVEWTIGPSGEITFLQCRFLHQLSRREKSNQEGGGENESLLLQSGVTASPGVGVGPVCIVRRNMDIFTFVKGSVLVVEQALPRWAALLDRAAAVISCQGSITGHLASVAREFKVPALFGVEEALDKLENGMEITIDADVAEIHRGRIQALVEKDCSRENFMGNGAVYQALKKASQHILPLNLIDPESPLFRPRNCQTLHDIVRFCHEKAVSEIFRIDTYRFPQNFSKQLVCQVPMQFWVVDLDDGFGKEIQGRYVHLKDIVSIPMLALWHGMMAIPWEGPPPLDAKGFISVLMEATSNTALDPSRQSLYSTRNYFMISKNFCSLQSRFGFHFSTTEAMIGDNPAENYSGFNFRGGAANLDRRIARACLLAEILEEHGFRVEVRKDSLFSRVEGLEVAEMEKKLNILGYLIIHTRQLDMVMANASSISHYKNKLRQDIVKILQ